MQGFRIRAATDADAGFMAEMLQEAVNWLPERNLTMAQIFDDPELAHYVSGWMRPGDLGVVAVDDSSRLGAAWLREFTSTDPGFGHIDDSTPELTIGVIRARRGQGIGRALLRALLDRARTRQIPAISLSVERANRAQSLYLAEGFKIVASHEDSDTLITRLT